MCQQNSTLPLLPIYSSNSGYIWYVYFSVKHMWPWQYEPAMVFHMHFFMCKVSVSSVCTSHSNVFVYLSLWLPCCSEHQLFLYFGEIVEHLEQRNSLVLFFVTKSEQVVTFIERLVLVFWQPDTVVNVPKLAKLICRCKFWNYSCFWHHNVDYWLRRLSI